MCFYHTITEAFLLKINETSFCWFIDIVFKDVNEGTFCLLDIVLKIVLCFKWEYVYDWVLSFKNGESMFYLFCILHFIHRSGGGKIPFSLQKRIHMYNYVCNC